jgi:cytochrome b involved in lipid metabolism
VSRAGGMAQAVVDLLPLKCKTLNPRATPFQKNKKKTRKKKKKKDKCWCIHGYDVETYVKGHLSRQEVS